MKYRQCIRDSWNENECEENKPHWIINVRTREQTKNKTKNKCVNQEGQFNYNSCFLLGFSTHLRCFSVAFMFLSRHPEWKKCVIYGTLNIWQLFFYDCCVFIFFFVSPEIEDQTQKLTLNNVNVFKDKIFKKMYVTYNESTSWSIKMSVVFHY